MTIGTVLYFDLAGLSEAAYADFTIGNSKLSLTRSGFSSAQADDLLSR